MEVTRYCTVVRALQPQSKQSQLTRSEPNLIAAIRVACVHARALIVGHIAGLGREPTGTHIIAVSSCIRIWVSAFAAAGWDVHHLIATPRAITPVRSPLLTTPVNQIWQSRVHFRLRVFETAS